MSRLAGMTYRDVIRRLRAAGFIFDRQARGSHEIWYNATTRRRTTVPNHAGAIPVGTVRNIAREAGIPVSAFIGGPEDDDG